MKKTQAVKQILKKQDITSWFQPIVDVETQELLGRISKHHLQEAVIPAYSDDYKVFLNRRFETRPDIYYWEVVSQNINDGTVSIYLLPDLDKLPSYGEKAIQFNKHKRTTHFLKQYNIVEVDFGHHVALLEGGSNQKKNTNYLSNLLQYELHKRRPCALGGTDQSKRHRRRLPCRLPRSRCRPTTGWQGPHIHPSCSMRCDVRMTD